ncbi:MAG: hypothetical protein AAF585_01510 [Verrucomicrobiota bacterium]
MKRDKAYQRAEKKIAEALGDGVTYLDLSGMDLTQLPDSFGRLVELETMDVSGNQLKDIPSSLADLENLTSLNLGDAADSHNPLNSGLAAAYGEGLEAVKRYLLAEAEAETTLNEAKLILIGEGAVGKSCLLGAIGLRRSGTRRMGSRSNRSRSWIPKAERRLP